MSDLVSILVPTYNHEKYICDLLDSLLNQSYKDIEIYLSDDNSNDGTYEVALSYQDKFKSQNIFFKASKNYKNIGICKNMNKLIKMAKGKYIKIIAGDDMLNNNAIEKYLSYYNNNQFLYIFSNAYIIGENDHYVNKKNNYEKIFKSVPNVVNESLIDDLYNRCFIPAPTVMFQKNTFLQFGLFDERFYAEDYPYWMHLCGKGRIIYIDETLVYYRVLKKSASHFNKLTKKMAKELFKMHFFIMNHYKNSILDKYSKKEMIKNKWILCYRYLAYGNLVDEYKLLMEFKRKNLIQFSIKDLLMISIIKFKKYLLYAKHIK